MPLSIGDDLFVGFIYKTPQLDINGIPVLVNGAKVYLVTDYPDGSSVVLTIDADTPVVGEGVISGSLATVWIDNSLLTPDLVPSKKLWRLQLIFADGRKKVICNGLTARSDGKPPFE